MNFFGIFLLAPFFVIFFGIITAISALFLAFSENGASFTLFTALASLFFRIIEAAYFFFFLHMPFDNLYLVGTTMSVVALIFITRSAYEFKV